ncbi:MAG TPA: filamentous hemagglutinin N-terminal domain-containing protein [Xenococcaceae cyanobacterium]
MKPVFLPHILQVSPLILAATLFGEVNPALSQASNIVPDNTLGTESSQVIENANGQPIEVITGGAQREQNLFHSFQEFNVSEGRGAFFANPEAVSNIFSRVTGSNPSNILGTLGVDGAANLYLINPNGIIFGANSSLNVQGSFTATTAGGIRFGEQGEFSAINPQAPQLLTINPSAYLFNQRSDQQINGIQSQGILAVSQGKNLVFLGGDINLLGNGGIGQNGINPGLYASGGTIEIGGLATTGEIGIDSSGNLVFPNDAEKSNVLLRNGIFADVRGISGGSISINANNLELSSSALVAQVLPGATTENNSAGDITINANNGILLNESVIVNQVSPSANGNSGIVNITANDLSLINNSGIDSSTFGQGNAGDIIIQVDESILLDSNGFISSNVVPGAIGDGGEIAISAKDLSITNGFQIQSRVEFSQDTLLAGQGDAGDINIDVTNGFKLEAITNNLASQIVTSIDPNVIGQGGDIRIQAGTITISNGAFINSGSGGQGDAGNIILQADGEIFIGGEGTGTFESPEGVIEVSIPSLVSTFVLPIFDLGEVEGNAGNINIEGESLHLVDGGLISASVARGEGGNITIEVDDAVVIDGVGSTDDFGVGEPGGIFNEIPVDGIGNAGDIKITANSVSINNGGAITASSFGIGTSGKIDIVARERVSLNGFGFLGDTQISSQIFTIADETGEGNANDINITTDSLELTNGAVISSETRRQGDAGNISIKEATSVFLSESAILSGVFGGIGQGGIISIETSSLYLDESAIQTVSQEGIGNAGDINLEIADSLTLTQQSNINSGVSLSEGDGGNINLTAGNSLNLSQNSAISGTVFKGSIGSGGDINIVSQNLSLTENSEISSENQAEGNAGNINIGLSNNIRLQKVFLNSSNITTAANQAAGGEINVTAEDIRLQGDSNILTNVNSGADNGGNITLTADSIIAFDDSDIFAFAADGRGGNVTLNTNVFFAENFTLNSLTANPDLLDENNRADVNATGNQPGIVSIPDVSFIQNSLTELPNNSIDTDELLANSCVVPAGDIGRGTFIITGGESLPLRPGEGRPSSYPTGEVRNVPEDNNSSWQPGDPIIEPQGVYRLTNGKLVLSRECR